jgi:site-specific DNA-cytosine methylase
LNILSLFDGMSCGQIALNRVNLQYDKYYASEIDKYAIATTQNNYPKTIQLGTIEDWKTWSIEQPSLIMGGSPCQGFSMSGKKLNFDDPRSKLFFTFVDIIKHYRPKYFLLENVKMKKEWSDTITEYLGVDPIEINSSLVSAQNRERLYWTNIPNINLPEDRNITLKSVILEDSLPIILHNIYGGFKEKTARVFINKSPTLRTAAGGGHIPSTVLKSSEFPTIDKAVSFFKNYEFQSEFKKYIRKLAPIECERLQTVPEGYTENVSDTQRYRMLGNGWTVDVIAHILNNLNYLPIYTIENKEIKYEENIIS